jgi:hypothetical protein
VHSDLEDRLLAMYTIDRGVVVVPKVVVARRPPGIGDDRRFSDVEDPLYFLAAR